MVNYEDLTFFNHLKKLAEDYGVVWKDSGEGFLWADIESNSKVIVYFFWLYEDVIKIDIIINGFHKMRYTLDERHFMELYEATGGKGSTIQDITRDDFESILSLLYNKVWKKEMTHKKV